MPLECPTILDFARLQDIMTTETITIRETNTEFFADGGGSGCVEIFTYPIDDWLIIRTALLCLVTSNIACTFTRIKDVWHIRKPDWAITEITVSVDHVYIEITENLSDRAAEKWTEEIRKLGQIPDSITITFVT